MVVNPLRSKAFGTWEVINNFNANGNTWTAPSDGFLFIKFSLGGASDVYVYASQGALPVATIACKGATGGYSLTTHVPVYEGQSFTMYTNQTSGINSYFMAIGE